MRAIPTEWREILESDGDELHSETIDISYELLVKAKKPCATIYNVLLKNSYDNKLFTTYWQRWCVTCDTMDIFLTLDEYRKCFKNIQKTTNVTKLRDFQYHLMLGKIFVKDTLFHWKIVDSNLCDICGNMVKQTIVHLMLECPSSIDIWGLVKEFFVDDSSIDWSRSNIFNNMVHKKAKHVSNFICLLVKQLIFACKCRNIELSKQRLEDEIIITYKIETYNAKLKYVLHKHQAKWSPLSQFLKHHGIEM